MNIMVLVFMERLLKDFVIPRGKTKENKLRKEVEGKVSGVINKSNISRGRNRFPTELITELEGLFYFKKYSATKYTT